jgi:pyruvate carboxylase subunit B
MTTEESIPEIHRAILAAIHAVPSGWTRRGHAPHSGPRKIAKLRVEIEGVSYDVSVEVLPENPHYESAEIELPESVTRPRPPLKLLEDTFCRSPIAGRVVAVLANSGQAIAKNEPVLVIEAMKMEVQISGAVDGVIKAIHVKPGESVASGQLLFELS